MNIINIITRNNSAKNYFSMELIKSMESMILKLNKLFKFNASVCLEFLEYEQYARNSQNDNIPQWVKALSHNFNIFIFTDRITSNDCVQNLLIHEYVHVCISCTFNVSCPVWLNEGLALYLSDQCLNVKPIRPKNAEEFYVSNQSDSEFYNKALYAVLYLLRNTTIPQVINSARMCIDFDNNPMLGIESIREIISESDMDRS